MGYLGKSTRFGDHHFVCSYTARNLTKTSNFVIPPPPLHSAIINGPNCCGIQTASSFLENRFSKIVVCNNNFVNKRYYKLHRLAISPAVSREIILFDPAVPRLNSTSVLISHGIENMRMKYMMIINRTRCNVHGLGQVSPLKDDQG